MLDEHSPTLFMDTEISCALWRLFEQLDAQIDQDVRVRAYLFGGHAVQLYTGNRYTRGVDVHFDRRVFIPSDLTVQSTLTDGREHASFINTQFNCRSVLMHPDALASSVRLNLNFNKLEIYVLSPLDLAVTKLERFSKLDRQDIIDLLKLELFTVQDMQDRSFQALDNYYGSTKSLKDKVIQAIGELKH